MNSLIIAGNIIKRVLKSPKEIIALILLPIILCGLLSWSLGRSDSSDTLIGLVDLDHRQHSRELVSAIEKIPDLTIRRMSETECRRALTAKHIQLMLKIPAHFSEVMERDAQVKVYLTGESPDAARIMAAINRYVSLQYDINHIATRIASETGQNKTEIYRELLNRAAQVRLAVVKKAVQTPAAAFTPASGNPAGNSNSITRMIFKGISLGFIIMFIAILVFITIGTILEDKKKLTLARMYVSPAHEGEIIAGNILGSMLIGVVQLIPMVLAIKYIYHLPFSMLPNIFSILLCFLTSVIGFGIGLSGIINDFNPSTLTGMIITPSCILGGCFIPPSMLPGFINKIGYIVPQRWAMNALDKTLNGGANLQAIATDLTVLLVFSLAFVTFGLQTIRPLQE